MLDTIPRPSLWKRLLIGAGLVIFAAAGATAGAAFHEGDRIAQVFQTHRQLRLGADLAVTNPGSPQTLMLLGSDRRPKNNGDPAAGGARSGPARPIRPDPRKNRIPSIALPPHS